MGVCECSKDKLDNQSNINVDEEKKKRELFKHNKRRSKSKRKFQKRKTKKRKIRHSKLPKRCFIFNKQNSLKSKKFHSRN
jgi:hypothetical protein